MTSAGLKKDVPGALPYVVFALGATFYLFQFVLRVSTNVLEPDLIRDLQADAYGLGMLSAYYYVSYALLQIPMGMLMDHYGPRRVVTLSIALCIMGAFLFAHAQTIFAAQIARFIMGAGSACAFISCLKLGSSWFTPQKFARIVGFTMLFGTVGATGGGTPLALLADAQGWRMAIYIVGGIGVAFMGVYWLLVRDHPPQIKEESHDMVKEVNALRKNLKAIIRNSQNWLIALFSLMAYIPITILGDSWGVPYLMSAYGVDRAEAAGSISMMFIGIALGSPVMAHLSDLYKSRKKIAYLGIGGAGLVLGFIFASIPHIPFFVTFGLFVVTGILMGSCNLAFTMMCERNPRSLSATASGFTNCITMSAAFVIHPLIGQVLKFMVTEETNGVYTVGDFQIALSLIPIGLLGSLLVMRKIRETCVLDSKGVT